jgi:hypothetical protein
MGSPVARIKLVEQVPRYPPLAVESSISAWYVTEYNLQCHRAYGTFNHLTTQHVKMCHMLQAMLAFMRLSCGD